MQNVLGLTASVHAIQGWLNTVSSRCTAPVPPGAVKRDTELKVAK